MFCRENTKYKQVSFLTNKPKLIIYEEQIFNVGDDTYIDSTAENNNAVVFEDNGETGYFYALDRSNDDIKMYAAIPNHSDAYFTHM